MKKYLYLGAVTLLSVGVLAGCSSSSGKSLSDTAIHTKNFDVSYEDVYKQLLTDTDHNSNIQTMVLGKLYEEKYPKLVSDDDVNESFDNFKSQYSNYETMLATYGITESQVKENLKMNLYIEKGVKKDLKVTDDQLKSAWETYQPDETIKLIETQDKSTATSVKDKVDSGTSISDLVSDNTINQDTDVDGQMTVNSSTTSLPSSVLEDIFEMKDGETRLLTYTDSTYGVTYYYVVQMVKSSTKSGNYDDADNKKTLTNLIKDSLWSNGDSSVYDVMKQLLDDNNVKINDSNLKDLFDSITSETTSASNTLTSSSSN